MNASVKPKKLTVGKGMNRRVTKAGRAVELSFNDRVADECRKMGGKPTGSTYPWQIETRAGTLLIGAMGSWIAQRFDDVDAAREQLGVKPGELHNMAGLNPFSGKWNFHYFDILEGASVEEAIARWLHHLDKVIDHCAACGARLGMPVADRFGDCDNGSLESGECDCPQFCSRECYDRGDHRDGDRRGS